MTCAFSDTRCVALKLMEMETSALEKLPSAEVAVLEIGFDESDQVCRINGLHGVYTMLMIHCRLLLFGVEAEELLRYELYIPPGFLTDQTARTVLNAVFLRLPIELNKLKRKVRILVVLILSGSAKTCLKVGQHFRTMAKITKVGHIFDGLVSMHSVCLMHQVALVVSHLLKNLGLLSPMFCASCLLQRGKARGDVKRLVLTSLRSLTMVYEKPPEWETNKSYLLSLFLLLTESESSKTFFGEDPGDAHQERQPTRMKQRSIEACERLAKNLAACVFENDAIVQWRHYCPLGCHESEAAARQEIEDDMALIHLDLLVNVPALNRWLKLFQPLSYFGVGTLLGYLPDAFENICRPDDADEILRMFDDDEAYLKYDYYCWY